MKANWATHGMSKARQRDQERIKRGIEIMERNNRQAEEQQEQVEDCKYCGGECRTPLSCGRRYRAEQQHGLV